MHWAPTEARQPERDPEREEERLRGELRAKQQTADFVLGELARAGWCQLINRLRHRLWLAVSRFGLRARIFGIRLRAHRGALRPLRESLVFERRACHRTARELANLATRTPLQDAPETAVPAG